MTQDEAVALVKDTAYPSEPPWTRGLPQAICVWPDTMTSFWQQRVPWWGYVVGGLALIGWCALLTWWCAPYLEKVIRETFRRGKTP